MAKDLQTLIRLNEWTVDERRRELGDVLASLNSLENGLHRLQDELAREQHAVQASPNEAGFFYGNYAAAVIQRRHHLNHGIAQMEAKVAEARDRLDEAYRELKNSRSLRKIAISNWPRKSAARNSPNWMKWACRSTA